MLYLATGLANPRAQTCLSSDLETFGRGPLLQPERIEGGGRRPVEATWRFERLLAPLPGVGVNRFLGRQHTVRR